MSLMVALSMLVMCSLQTGMLQSMMALKNTSIIPGLGCFACRHPCCFFTNCTKAECPVCHLNVPLCQKNCKCNIFTSDESISPPWLDSPDASDPPGPRSGDTEDDMRHCGPEQCGLRCARGEFCANTGQPELCQSVKCIQFNV